MPFQKASDVEKKYGSNGSLHYMRQTHILANGTFPPTYLESQQNVLDALLRLQPRNVFVEGRFEDFRQAANPQLSNVRKCFNGYKPGEELSNLQKQLLMKGPPGSLQGGALIYCCLFEGATIRATQSKKTAIKVSRFRASKNINKKIEQNQKFVFSRREKEAVALINKFFQANPGNPDENTALIFGHRHDFSQYSGSMRGLRFHDDAEMPKRRSSGNNVWSSQNPLNPCDTEQIRLWQKTGDGYTPLGGVPPITGPVTYVDQNGVAKVRDFGSHINVLDFKDKENIKAVLGVIKVRNAGTVMDFRSISGRPTFLRDVVIVAGEMGMKITNIPDAYKQAYKNATETLKLNPATLKLNPATLKLNPAAVKRPSSAWKEVLSTLRQGRVTPSRGAIAPTQTR